MDDSAIIFDGSIESYDEETKTVPTNFNEKNITCRTKNFYILLAFLLIIIALLTAVSFVAVLIAAIDLLLSYKISNKTKIFITIPQHK